MFLSFKARWKSFTTLSITERGTNSPLSPAPTFQFRNPILGLFSPTNVNGNNAPFKRVLLFLLLLFIWAMHGRASLILIFELMQVPNVAHVWGSDAMASKTKRICELKQLGAYFIILSYLPSGLCI